MNLKNWVMSTKEIVILGYSDAYITMVFDMFKNKKVKFKIKSMSIFSFRNSFLTLLKANNNSYLFSKDISG
jgi:hypothetical protein